MLKRTLAGVVGVLAILSGLLAFYAVIKLLLTSQESFAEALAHSVVVGFVALGGLAAGAGFLRFSFSGRGGTARVRSPLHALLLGIGCFFPGFLISLPLTFAWAAHHWPGDGQSGLAAFPISFLIGIVSAGTATILLLRQSSQRVQQ